MATTTATTFLMYKTKGSTEEFEKLIDIIDYPDMGSTPSKLDTTTLSAEKFKTSILGLQELPDLTFTSNYDLTTYTLIDSLKDEYDFELQFGTAGINGKFDWTGTIQVYANGGGVDEVRKMTITLSAETEIVMA